MDELQLVDQRLADLYRARILLTKLIDQAVQERIGLQGKEPECSSV